jgi:hypothetical protein
MMAITTLEQVKLVLGIEGTDKDDQVSALIPMVEQDYLIVRNKPFDVDDDGDTVYPDGAEYTAILMIEHCLLAKPMQGTYGSVQSESLARYSVTYASVDGMYPKNITGRIKRYARFV